MSEFEKYLMDEEVQRLHQQELEEKKTLELESEKQLLASQRRRMAERKKAAAAESEKLKLTSRRPSPTISQKVPFSDTEDSFDPSTNKSHVVPFPVIVIKSKILNTEQKFFINICTCESSAEESVRGRSLGYNVQATTELHLFIVAVGDVSDVVDKNGLHSFCIDVVIDARSATIIKSQSESEEDEEDEYDPIAFALLKFVSSTVKMNIDLTLVVYPRIKGNYKGDATSPLPIYSASSTLAEVKSKRPSRLALVAEQRKLIEETGVKLWNDIEHKSDVQTLALATDDDRTADHFQSVRKVAEEAEIKRKEIEEVERQKRATEEVERLRKVAEEVERLKIAAEEAERQKKIAEEAERIRKEAEEVERQKRAAEEAERLRKVAEEIELQRKATEEAERL
jgi:hypothetical protein